LQPGQTTRPAEPGVFWIYCFRTALIASAPTLLGVCVVLVTTYFNSVQVWPQVVKLPFPDLWELFGNIVFAPFAETALLVTGLLVLGKGGLSPGTNSIICALAFGVLHGVLQGWIKFPVAAWGFYFFANAFQLWRQSSIMRGVLAAWVPHVIVNAAVMAVLAAYAI
jgi:hypothetical protein